MNLVSRDRQLIWHPFTQEKTAGLPIAIQSGKGSYLYDDSGQQLLDLISSWWVNLHGHGHPAIANAIYQQAQQLDHVLYAGFTHEPSVKLCEKLQAILPKTLNRFFYSDNGSTATEVAIKMAHQYWHNQGVTDRNLYLSFEGGYHGDTFGAMSVGRNETYHRPFKSLMFDVASIPFPETWLNDLDCEQKEATALARLKAVLEKDGARCSALILEPLVQGAGGMRMCRPSFIESVVEMVRSYDILVIFDEVMTGFGRLGTHFALNQLTTKPDFLCLSKGITGGFLPLALTVTTTKVYDQFYSDEWDKAFTHGHSYTANPIACAAGIASLELLLNTETQQSIANIVETHRKQLPLLEGQLIGKIKRPRSHGTIAAFDTVNPQGLSTTVIEAFTNSGLLIRPLGNTVYLLPPYSTTPEMLTAAYNTIASVLSNIG